MVKTVTRYLTRRPNLEAGIELRHIAMKLKSATRITFEKQLQEWHEKWKEFIAEKTVDASMNCWQYTHRRIRGAYFSIMRTLPYLFTFEELPTYDIPKTTNSLDGTFSHLKQKIHIHRGLNIETQKKMVETILNTPANIKRPTENVH